MSSSRSIEVIVRSIRTWCHDRGRSWKNTYGSGVSSVRFRTVYQLIHSLGGRNSLAFVLVECPSVVGSGHMAGGVTGVKGLLETSFGVNLLQESNMCLNAMNGIQTLYDCIYSLISERVYLYDIVVVPSSVLKCARECFIHSSSSLSEKSSLACAPVERDG